MKDGAKKALTWILVIIGVFAFLAIGVAVVMMLSPGLEIFGVKYISAKIGNYSFNNNTVYNKDIHISSQDVPIKIYFGDNVGIEYVQQFQGFTMSSNEPSVSITNADGEDFQASRDNAVYIKVGQYKKFIWANSMKDFYINIGLPTTFSATNSIYIDSDSSNVQFLGYTQNLKRVEISTNGSVELKNTLTINGDLKVSSKNSVVLSNSVKVNGSVVANIAGNLTIENVVGGDINYTTTGGNLKFNTCKNLVVKSSSGSIKNPTSEQISGNLNFETNSGSVEISHIAGTQNKIKSTSGTIDIGTVTGTLEIDSARARVNIDSAQNLKVTTSTGDITVGNVTNKLESTTTANGDILVTGTVGGNATLSSKNGMIQLKKAVLGNLEISNTNGKVYMVSCKNLTAKLGDGGLYYASDSGNGITISGTAEIESNKGAVNIYSIAGSVNKIDSKYGKISVASCSNTLNISSYNAPIEIGLVRTLVIKATYSPITVKTVTSSANVVTSNAVTMGDGGYLEDVTVNSQTGVLKLYNTDGEVVAYSNTKIELYNGLSNKISLNRKKSDLIDTSKFSKGDIYAENLRGEVYAYSKGSVELKFDDVTGNVDVWTGVADSSVKISATDTAYNQVNYDLKCQGGKACHVYWGNTAGANDGKSTITNQNGSSYPTIKVRTDNAPITLNLKSL